MCTVPVGSPLWTAHPVLASERLPVSHTDTDESGFSLLHFGAAGEEWGFLRKRIPLFALLLIPLVSELFCMHTTTTWPWRESPLCPHRRRHLSSGNTGQNLGLRLSGVRWRERREGLPFSIVRHSGSQSRAVCLHSRTPGLGLGLFYLQRSDCPLDMHVGFPKHRSLLSCPLLLFSLTVQMVSLKQAQGSPRAPLASPSQRPD